MSNPKLVGILNLTPDSFSDGGLYNQQDSAAKQLKLMLEVGADVIDIGAVSTRPHSAVPSAAEEISRFAAVLPTIKPILESYSAKISIDTCNFATIKYLMDIIHIDWINDQSGFTDQKIVSLLKDTNIKLVIMHHTCLPADPKNTVPLNLDIIEVVKNWLLEKAKNLQDQGIKKEQIIIDPGIGFGKTANQSWELIRKANSLVNLGFPVLYGHSRKSFLNIVTAAEFSKRDLETAIISSYLSDQGIDFLRVHDVDSSLRMLKIRAQIRGEI